MHDGNMHVFHFYFQSAQVLPRRSSKFRYLHDSAQKGISGNLHGGELYDRCGDPDHDASASLQGVEEMKENWPDSIPQSHCGFCLAPIADGFLNQWSVAEMGCESLTPRRLRNCNLTLESPLCEHCATSVFTKWLPKVHFWNFGPQIAVQDCADGHPNPKKKRKVNRTQTADLSLQLPAPKLTIDGAEIEDINARWDIDEADMYLAEQDNCEEEL